VIEAKAKKGVALLPREFGLKNQSRVATPPMMAKPSSGEPAASSQGSLRAEVQLLFLHEPLLGNRE
jgi:hypothetical protein